MECIGQAEIVCPDERFKDVGKIYDVMVPFYLLTATYKSNIFLSNPFCK